MPTQDIEIEKKALAKEYKELLRISYQSLSKEDKKLIRKAFDYAVEAHQHQRRKSGEAYIFHPIAVAKIVAAEIGLDAISIASALIHDVVEDNSDHTLEKIKNEGVKKRIKGILFDSVPCPPCAKPFPVLSKKGNKIGQITSGIYNPRIKKNTGLSMIDIEFWDEGNIIEVQLGDNKITEGIINNIPFS